MIPPSANAPTMLILALLPNRPSSRIVERNKEIALATSTAPTGWMYRI